VVKKTHPNKKPSGTVLVPDPQTLDRVRSKVLNPEKLRIVQIFAEKIRTALKAKHCLKIEVAHLSIFEVDGSNFEIANETFWIDQNPEKSNYDFILGELPIGVDRISHDIPGLPRKVRRNWIYIYNSLRFLSENGFAIYMVEPTAFGLRDGIRFESAINEEGYFVNAIFNAPPQFLHPQTSITPTFILISKNKSKNIFIAELLNIEQVENVVKNFTKGIEGEDLRGGMFIPSSSFQSFNQIKATQQIEKLKTEYKQFLGKTIHELSENINHIRPGQKIVEKENSIYIPKLGSSPVVSSISDLRIKPHNYFQIELSGQAINEYVALFFKSALGQLTLESLKSQTHIAHINRSSLEQALIPIPEIEDQQSIIETQRKLTALKEATDQFDKELALNPSSSESMSGQLDEMLGAINKLTEGDKIRSIIRKGEDTTIEFKETFSLDLKKNSKQKYIELAVMKTVAAFLNTDGGTLLVGVNDDGLVTGIEKEIKKLHKNSDKFLLHIKNNMKNRIGEPYYPFIDYKIVPFDQKLILKIECQRAESACYLDGSDFYVRTNPATDKLEGPTLVEYVKTHFK
jgi:hypothetical protein